MDKHSRIVGYTQTANSAFEAALAVRSASRDAAFIVPHLRSGMQLLDVGCGPGSITLGLAEIVAPGEVVGIDAQSKQIEQSRELASARGRTNVRFETADVYQLPFADATFDIVFAHAVFMHLREPARALVELRRVLCPDGIAALRDPDVTASFRGPTTALLEQWRTVGSKVFRHNGGNPAVGRDYRRMLLDAGFARAEAGASADSAGTAEETFRKAEFFKAQARGYAHTALANGWTDQETVDAILADLDRWGGRPDSFAITVWCEAIAWVRA